MAIYSRSTDILMAVMFKWRTLHALASICGQKAYYSGLASVENSGHMFLDQKRKFLLLQKMLHSIGCVCCCTILLKHNSDR